MGLTNVLNAVQDQVTAVLGSLGEKLPNFGFGLAAKFKYEATPRVTWIPMNGPHKPAQQRGDIGNTNPRQLWTRQVTIQARIWHDDYDSAEALMNHIVAAIHRYAVGSYRPSGEVWDTDSAVQKGVLVALTFSIDIPLTDEPNPEVIPNHAPIDGQIATS